MEMDARTRLIDYGDYPSIYADGMGRVDYVGGNARLSAFAWRKVDGVFQPVVCCLLIRPVATITPHIDQMIARALATPPMTAWDRAILHFH